MCICIYKPTGIFMGLGVKKHAIADHLAPVYIHFPIFLTQICLQNSEAGEISVIRALILTGNRSSKLLSCG